MQKSIISNNQNILKLLKSKKIHKIQKISSFHKINQFYIKKLPKFKKNGKNFYWKFTIRYKRR